MIAPDNGHDYEGRRVFIMSVSNSWHMIKILNGDDISKQINQYVCTVLGSIACTHQLDMILLFLSLGSIFIAVECLINIYGRKLCWCWEINDLCGGEVWLALHCHEQPKQIYENKNIVDDNEV